MPPKTQYSITAAEEKKQKEKRDKVKKDKKKQKRKEKIEKNKKDKIGIMLIFWTRRGLLKGDLSVGLSLGTILENYEEMC